MAQHTGDHRAFRLPREPSGGHPTGPQHPGIDQTRQIHGAPPVTIDQTQAIDCSKELGDSWLRDVSIAREPALGCSQSVLDDPTQDLPRAPATPGKPKQRCLLRRDLPVSADDMTHRACE